MTGTLIRRATHATPHSAPKTFSETEVFFCPEESHFYSHCLERLVFSTCSENETVIEFGSGDGSPIINALMRTRFDSVVHGYELNPSAVEVARSRVEEYELHQKYVVHNESFYEADRPDAHYLIANPPYLPAPDNQICMPLLHGGCDGAKISNTLLTLDYPSVMVLISSYSNPIETLQLAFENGYYVTDFMVTPLQFGYYSSEPKVRNTIDELRKAGKAFFSQNIYLLAGVLFKKQHLAQTDVTKELTQVLTSL